MLMQACSLKQPSNKCSQNIAAFSAEQIPAAKAAVFLCYKNGVKEGKIEKMAS